MGRPEGHPQLAASAQTYMTLPLEQGLLLRRFAEPAPVGGDPQRVAPHRRVP